MNNAFLRVFKKLHLFDTSRSFENWFAKIIVHSSSDYYRYAKPETQDIEEYIPYLEEDSLNIIDQLGYEELLNCISNLSPQYRMVFNLYVIDGYKHAEIADLLNISEGTSKSNLSKAKRTLQNILKEKYEIQSSSQ